MFPYKLYDQAIAGVNIRKRRKKLGLTQTDLVTPDFPLSFIREVERGHAYYSEEFLAYITLLLGVSYEELVKVPDTPSKKTGYRYWNQQLEKAYITQQSRDNEGALNILAELNSEDLPDNLKALYYSIAGEARLGMAKYEESRQDLEKAVALFEKDSKTPLIRKEQTRNFLGAACYHQGKYREALEHHSRCLQMFIEGKLTDPTFKIKVYHSVASDYLYLGEPGKAETYYLEAAATAETRDEPTILGHIYWGLGAIYNHSRDYPKSKLYYFKSAQQFQNVGDLKSAAAVKSQAGLGMIEAGEYAQAEIALKSAVEISQTLADKMGETMGLGNLAYLYLTQNRLIEARQNAEVALVLSHEQNNRAVTAQAISLQADILVEQGLVEEGLSRYEEAAEILREAGIVEYLIKIYIRHSEALEKLGFYREALEKYKQVMELKNRGSRGTF